VILRALRLERVVCRVCGMDNLHRRSRPLALDARCWGCSAHLRHLPDLVVTISVNLEPLEVALRAAAEAARRLGAALASHAEAFQAGLAPPLRSDSADS
jgi:hypothetical protein